MRKILKQLNSFFIDVIEDAKSIILVILFCRTRNKKFSAKEKTINILGNGPSLIDVLNSKDEAVSNPIMVTNSFCESDAFFRIKPEYYILIDPLFFKDNVNDYVKNQQTQIQNIFQKIDWSITLLMPAQNKKTKLAKFFGTLDKINIIYINITPIDGHMNLRHFLYKLGLGTPQCQNVINAALMVAINGGFQEIILYGADHSWFKDFIHNEDGDLCEKRHHFYNNNHSLQKISPGRIEFMCGAMQKCFKTYRYIKAYSDQMNVRIINKTNNSFIDVFPRI